MSRWWWAALLGLALTAAVGRADPATVRVGSKNFTESYLLAEMLSQRLEQAGLRVERRFGLGGTKVCFDALRNNEIDLYPEYNGTVREAIIKDSTLPMDATLAQFGLATYAPLGFNNTYVLAAREVTAAQRNIRRISDLAAHSDLRIALSHEFRARGDGWAALQQHYGFELPATGIEHGLAYQAIAARQIDLTDAYSTDGELSRYALRLLDDDLDFFPRYDALWLGRQALPPQVTDVLGALADQIDDTQMQALNARAVLDEVPIASVAREFLARLDGVAVSSTAPSDAWTRQLASNTWRHVQLTVVALVLAAVAGIALALCVQPFARLTAALLTVCGLIQTVPSIALLALMIPLFGIGVVPAVIALFAYALLPVVRATLTAINAIDPVHITVADALGMSPAEKRRYVQVPLAMPHIIAGLRTAAVISIGTATLAAFIGAGGLGQPIVTGLALNNSTLIMQGAIPAAALAVATDLAFDALERRLVPAHLRTS
ncbi:MAG: glycine betaine ABC transporter substrate-binding protein [Pseudomonadota bacterium]